MSDVRLYAAALSKRRFSDLLLFGVTLAELVLLIRMTPDFGMADWIYVLQHGLVLAIALTRPPPKLQDHSLPVTFAVVVSYTYPYAQIIYLGWIQGVVGWPLVGLVILTLAACLSLFGLVSLGRLFGIRPALRGRLVTGGPYAVVRHPLYLAYVLGDIGYNLQEWNAGTVLMVIAGWASLLVRIRAEERLLSQHADWPAYAASVRYRLIPGLW